MANTLTLEIPQSIYALLVERAKQSGKTPEQVALEWVEHAAKSAVDDPLLRLAGAFESNLSDISERHNEYIGQQLRIARE